MDLLSWSASLCCLVLPVTMDASSKYLILLWGAHQTKELVFMVQDLPTTVMQHVLFSWSFLNLVMYTQTLDLKLQLMNAQQSFVILTNLVLGCPHSVVMLSPTVEQSSWICFILNILWRHRCGTQLGHLGLMLKQKPEGVIREAGIDVRSQTLLLTRTEEGMARFVNLVCGMPDLWRRRHQWFVISLYLWS